MATSNRQAASRGIPADPTAVITVIAWRDPVVEQNPASHPTSSTDTLVWWTPILGPSATLMAHRFAGYVARGGEMQFTLGDLARTLGMGASTTKVRATIDRLARFGVVEVFGTTVQVRVALPPLTERQVQQLPSYLAVFHDRRAR
jgi:hypothetical protein